MNELKKVNEEINHILEQMNFILKRMDMVSSENEKIIVLLEYGKKKIELERAYNNKVKIIDRLNSLSVLLDLKDRDSYNNNFFMKLFKRFRG